MTKTFLSIVIIILFFVGSLHSQELPKGLTKAEVELMKSYVSPSASPEAFTTPPPFPVRTMAEWEQLSGIIITWTSYQSILRQIVDFAQEECLVYIVCSDSNSVKTYLTQGGVPHNNLKFIIAPFNSIWVRDYGPWTVYGNVVDSMVLVDWVYNRPRPSDDALSQAFANAMNYPLYQTINEPTRLVATGGNFMVDGLGTGFSSHLVTNENTNKTEAQINQIMSDYMGLDRYIKMSVLPYDGIHHIDMHMKLLDEETLLVGQYPAGVSDGPQIELNLQYILNNFLTPYGRPYKVVRIPMPPDGNNQYPSQGGDYRTFTNSVFVNKTVIVPTYDLRYDSTALRIYRESLPGYTVVGINSNAIIPASGAIHCITKEIGVTDPVFIAHDPVQFRRANPGTGYTIKAFVKSKHPITSVNLFYSTNIGGGWQSVPLSSMSGDTMSCNIPEFPVGTKIYYYFETITTRRTITKPVTAPASYYVFTSDEPLPVELISFDGYSQNGEVVLKWVTATELNNKEFIVEKQIEGSDVWLVTGSIPGKGTILSRSEYSFIDKNPGNGVVSYRLKQVDFDGTSTLSTSVEVTIGVFEYCLYQNYPNPFNPSTNIFFDLKEDGMVNLVVYNSIGEKVGEPVNGFMNKGIHKVRFEAMELPAGVYFYRLSVQDLNGVKAFSQTKKMILAK